MQRQAGGRGVGSFRVGRQLAVASLAVAAISGPASAAGIFLVDFSADVINQGGGPGGKWNTYATPGSVNGSTMLTAANAASTITIKLDGTATDNSQAEANVFEPNRTGYEGSPSWAVSTTDNTAAGDFFYTNNSATSTPHTYTVTFGGLTVGDKVSLDLLASRNSADSKGYYDYSLDGGTTWFGFRVLNHDGTVAATNNWSTNDTKGQVYRAREEGFQLHRYMNVSDLALTQSTFLVRVTDADAATATFSNINAMRLTVVPEPATAALVGVAAAGLLARRRRQGATIR